VSPVSRSTAAGRSYLDLKAAAKRAGRTTDEYIQLFVLEGFLARLAASSHRDQFILKGGVLLAALGSRRATGDVDFAGIDIDNNAEQVLRRVRQIAGTSLPNDDGLAFESDDAAAALIRDQEEYAGVRVTMGVTLATARHRFHVDVNVGDPIWPEPASVAVPRLLGGPPIELSGYPLTMVHAEKLITAIQRGTANTRWRDFADIWVLSRRHPLSGDELQRALLAVADHRNTRIVPLRAALDGYPDIAQARWSAWQRRQNIPDLPTPFSDLLEDLYSFAEPPLAGLVSTQSWAPSSARWV
jgi:Nucleotidyl transferase AbiEii toxin, Type IV TA system